MKPALDPSWTWKSWISSANEPGCDFPLQNLPFCAFEVADEKAHIGVGIGDFVLDLHEVAETSLLASVGDDVREVLQSAPPQRVDGVWRRIYGSSSPGADGDAQRRSRRRPYCDD